MDLDITNYPFWPDSCLALLTILPLFTYSIPAGLPTGDHKERCRSLDLSYV